MPHDANYPDDLPARPLPADVADVLIDVEVVRAHVAALGERLALTIPRERRAVCVRLAAVVGDIVDLLDDTASGRAAR